MKITDVVIHPLAADHDDLSWTAHEPFGRSILTLVEIRTDAGITGHRRVASGPQAQVCEMLKHDAPVIKAWIRAVTPRSGRSFSRSPFRARAGSGDWDGLPRRCRGICAGFFMAAMAGIDIALWDIKGKAVDLPVFRLLGGTRTKVHTYAVGGMYRPHRPMLAVADELAAFVARLYRGQAQVRRAFADGRSRAHPRRARCDRPDIELMLDCNAGYDVTSASNTPTRSHLTTSRGSRSRCTGTCSRPTTCGSRRQSRFRSLTVSAKWHRFTARDFIDSGAIRYLQFDSVRYGGFTEGLRVGMYAEQKGVLVQPHSWPHLHAHLVSALGDACYGAECVGDPHMHPVHHRIFHDGAYYKDGCVHLTESPGFGLTVDWQQVNALTV
jgi:D-galactarolactone cycloisomerase